MSISLTYIYAMKMTQIFLRIAQAKRYSISAVVRMRRRDDSSTF